MRRPRIALWIRYQGGGWASEWLWCWAVRRVDKWHEEQHRQLNDACGLVMKVWEGEQPVPRIDVVDESPGGHAETPRRPATLTGKLHR